MSVDVSLLHLIDPIFALLPGIKLLKISSHVSRKTFLRLFLPFPTHIQRSYSSLRNYLCVALLVLKNVSFTFLISRHIYLNTWSSGHGTLWEELGGELIVEEVCYWEDWTLRIQKPTSLTLSSFFFLLADQDISSELLLQCHAYLLAAMLAAMMDKHSNFNSLNQ